MKRTRLLTALLLACTVLTACGRANVPPADYDSESPAAEAAAEAATETGTSTGDAPSATTTAATLSSGKSTTTTTLTGTQSTTDTTPADTDETTEDDTDETDDDTEPQTAPWAETYARLLRIKNAASEHIDAYYALIRLNPDDIPELVILDDVYMQLYTCRDTSYELLMEDAYKSSAYADQNVCYQPLVGKFASYFSTMGGGTGYHIFVYEQLDTSHVTRYYFNNNEDEGGEMPYNPIWDSAEEFGISNNGWTDVTLDDRWTHIGEGYSALYELTNADALTLQSQWEALLERTADDEPDETE